SEGQNLNFAIPVDYVAELCRAASSWIRSHPVVASSTGKREDSVNGSVLPPVVSARSVARMVRSFRKAKNYEAAKALLEAGDNRFPVNPDLLLQMAELNWDLRRFDEAMTFTKQLIDVAPESPYGHQCLSALLRRKGMIAEAQKEAERCLSLNPDPEYA